MVKIPHHIVSAQTEQIKRYMYIDHLYDRDIINKLGIAESTFYKYKQRIQKQESDIWDKIAVDSAKFRATDLLRSLEEAVRLNEQIRDNEKEHTKDRQESAHNVVKYKGYIYQLVSNNINFKQLPLIETRVKSAITTANTNTNNSSNKDSVVSSSDKVIVVE